jgi:hypothetical protein
MFALLGFIGGCTAYHPSRSRAVTAAIGRRKAATGTPSAIKKWRIVKCLEWVASEFQMIMKLQRESFNKIKSSIVCTKA